MVIKYIMSNVAIQMGNQQSFFMVVLAAGVAQM
jgi:hypothetical protein